MKFHGPTQQIARATLLFGLALTGSPTQAEIDGALDKRSIANLAIEFEIVRGAIVRQPPSLALNKGLKFLEGSPARPKWLLQGQELSGDKEFHLCLPSMYAGSQLSLLAAQASKANGNPDRGNNPLSNQSNDYALAQASPRKPNANDPCGKEPTLQVSIESKVTEKLSRTPPRKNLDTVTMIISPE